LNAFGSEFFLKVQPVETSNNTNLVWHWTVSYILSIDEKIYMLYFNVLIYRKMKILRVKKGKILEMNLVLVLKSESEPSVYNFTFQWSVKETYLLGYSIIEECWQAWNRNAKQKTNYRPLYDLWKFEFQEFQNFHQWSVCTQQVHKNIGIWQETIEHLLTSNFTQIKRGILTTI
jgi:hypothetical protein